MGSRILYLIDIIILQGDTFATILYPMAKSLYLMITSLTSGGILRIHALRTIFDSVVNKVTCKEIYILEGAPYLIVLAVLILPISNNI